MGLERQGQHQETDRRTEISQRIALSSLPQECIRVNEHLCHYGMLCQAGVVSYYQ